MSAIVGGVTILEPDERTDTSRLGAYYKCDDSSSSTSGDTDLGILDNRKDSNKQSESASITQGTDGPDADGQYWQETRTPYGYGMNIAVQSSGEWWYDMHYTLSKASYEVLWNQTNVNYNTNFSGGAGGPAMTRVATALGKRYHGYFFTSTNSTKTGGCGLGFTWNDGTTQKWEGFDYDHANAFAYDTWVHLLCNIEVVAGADASHIEFYINGTNVYETNFTKGTNYYISSTAIGRAAEDASYGGSINSFATTGMKVGWAAVWDDVYQTPTEFVEAGSAGGKRDSLGSGIARGVGRGNR